MKKPINLKNNKGDDLVPPQQDILLPETADIQKLNEPISSPTEVTIPIPPESSRLDEPLIVQIQNSAREPGRRHEWDVLKAIVSGCGNKDIADTLHISVRTVETHRLRIKKKLGASSTAALVKLALEKGLVN